MQNFRSFETHFLLGETSDEYAATKAERLRAEGQRLHDLRKLPGQLVPGAHDERRTRRQLATRDWDWDVFQFQDQFQFEHARLQLDQAEVRPLRRGAAGGRKLRSRGAAAGGAVETAGPRRAAAVGAGRLRVGLAGEGVGDFGYLQGYLNNLCHFYPFDYSNRLHRLLAS